MSVIDSVKLPNGNEYDVMAKLNGATNGNLAAYDQYENLVDSGVAATDVLVINAGATDGNIVSYDENGNIEDSGVAVSDLIVKNAGATDGHIASYDENGDLEDSGIEISSVTANTVIAPVEAGATASQSYAVGEQFIKAGKYCTAKTAITSGDAFVVNTNYTEGTVADSLALKATITALNNAKAIVPLYIDGESTVGTLSESIYNFDSILVVAKCNNFIQTNFMPTDYFNSNTAMDFVFLADDTLGTISDFAYKSSIVLNLNSNTTWSSAESHTNPSFVPIIKYIYGIGRK